MWSVGQRINIEFLENQEFIVVKHMEGGMGDVYKVVEPNLVGFFSIKTLKHSMDVSDFKNECQIFVTASLHSSCVKPVGYGLIDSHLVIAYPWYESSLADHNSKKWMPAEIENLLSELISFFHYACNDLKILHCDIKPSNILIDGNKKPFVTDFGISRMLEKSESMFTSHEVAGTREYMAPELIFTKRQNVKSELYSFGITIYEFLTGEHPYINELAPEKSLKKIAKNFKILNKRLGKSMICYLTYIEKCISVESAKRPENFRLIESTNLFTRPLIEQSNHALIESIVLQASYYRKENDFSRAEQILLDALILYGRDPVLLNALGSTYTVSRSRESAISPFEESSNIVFQADCVWHSLLYLDPILNLSIQYRCTGRHHNAFELLHRAWNILIKHRQVLFFYSEFGWMMTYEGNFNEACSYMEKCFLKRAIQPFEMLFFTEAAWISGKIEKYADKILSNVIYNDQFDCSYFLCAFLLSKYSSDQTVARLMTIVDQKSLLEIQNFENKFQLPLRGLRPPQSESIEKIVILVIDHMVTSGKNHNKILGNN